MISRLLAALVTVSILFVADSRPAHADEDYPARAVRVIASSAPGGNSDSIARMMAQHLTERLGKPFVVENRPGAASNIGADAIAKSAPDGYTIGIIAVNTHAINPNLSSKLLFDHVRDFSPISQLTAYPNILVVNPAKIPARTLPDLIALLKANPGKYTFASSGRGSSLYLSAELFMSMTGVKMVHVPYKGSGPMLTDLVAGHVDLAFDNIPSSLPHVRSGALIALGVTSRERVASLPDIPVVGEALPGYEATSWHGLAGPAGIPPQVRQKLGAESIAIMRLPQVVELLVRSGGTAVGSTSEDFAAHIARETEKWGKVIRAIGLKAD